MFDKFFSKIDWMERKKSRGWRTDERDCSQNFFISLNRTERTKHQPTQKAHVIKYPRVISLLVSFDYFSLPMSSRDRQERDFRRDRSPVRRQRSLEDRKRSSHREQERSPGRHRRRKRRRRHRSPEDNRRHDRSKSRRGKDRRRNEREYSTDRRRRRRRYSSSPESRRRGRRRRRRHRRRDRSFDYERPIRVAADVLPRAGVVSDDDDGHQAPGKKHPERSPSSHDDTVGHFRGKEGTVIANRFRIIRDVGLGTFGRVCACLDLKSRNRQNEVVAIKIVRNVSRYFDSARIEADIIEDVNKRGGRGVSHCAVMFDSFTFLGHYCMVFESLGPSLYDVLKRRNYQGFPFFCVRDFARQLLETLEFLHSFRLIHTDLKPENILLLNDREVHRKGCSWPESTRIKVIDFGGATYDDDKKSSIVNTRQYRAPEVILGVGWSMPSDLWSLGCILAELYQGELLFATHDNIEHLALIEEVIGPFPLHFQKRAKNEQLLNQAFDSFGWHRMGKMLAPESLAYVKRVGSLESMYSDDKDQWFLRLLRRMLVIDPNERATARECLRKF